MPTRLEKAAKSYRQAQSALEDVRDRLAVSRAAVDKARAELTEAVIEAARGGMRQVDIVAASGYTRERVRQICRAAGIKGD